MADIEDSVRAKITNTASGPRGIRPIEGPGYLEPGQSYTGAFTAAELASARMTDGLRADDPDEQGEDLSAHTVAELKTIAESEGVDLGDATKKADIIAAIEAKRAG